MVPTHTIDKGWLYAHNLYIDKDCPKVILEVPYLVGSNVSIGSVGFGYEQDKKPGFLKIRDHRYGVIVKAGGSIHDGVIIHRGNWRDTVIGNNARLNAKSFIGHNVQTGRNLLMGFDSGVSGSTTIGDNVRIWTKAYIEQRCFIGDGAIIGAFSHVRKNTKIGENEVWFNREKPYATKQRMRNRGDF